MRRKRSARALLTTLATAVASAGMVVLGGGAAHAAATPLPAHVFAPYFEAYNGDSLADLSQQSGAKYLTMAFLQTEARGSCTPYWNGDTGQPVSSSVYGSDITTMRSRGGDVIPSFGGYAADNGSTEIADSCTDVDSIAAAYEKVITTYDVSRLDMDIEDNSLTNKAGIDRRNQAIKKVQDWAAANGRTVQISYTLPTTTSGLASSGLAVLKSANTYGAKVDVVNLMTFDYYDNASHNMATDTQTATTGLEGQLASLYPTKTAAQLWGMIGVIEMPGIDDFGAAETFTTADATSVYNWATSKGINTLSFWALQRDNGGCPGTGGSDTCSGIAQDPWYFSHTFEPFTGGGAPATDDFSLSAAPGSASVDPGGTTTSTVSTAVTSGAAQSVTLKATGAPAGVTAALSPASVTAGGTSKLTVSASATAAPGTYPITITGTAGSVSHSSTFTLTVSGPGGSTGSLVNGNFESGSLSPWTCESGASVVATPAHGGTHAVKTAPSASQLGECAQTLTLAPNKAYTLSGWVQGDYAYLGVRGGATGSAWTSSSGWSKLSVPFTTDASGSVTVYLHGWYGQGSVYGDDLSVS
ncbi:glycosyl hydrolase family 18 protein [Streptomyces sp. NBC_01387]|uniref:glycosyl hydrolase family 18 protein n=1 Tax=unclassified Streptomyces TaxID=2593676 RepID=UPI00224E2064|nr:MULTISPECIES: glycosyl hydrolase family 18 protein [unclassified Streptomyces]MCX4552660.1 glycosyl hydrolase family 18 protein [Streptomyces sp. NBC_01500]WSC24000.1 glycosyl hydrolase family 18 protein [Streptomyces sp. NBC_01766]WSV57883.1 glycosyl hydrolase family 18 protein [Streptomyces sp. NBC_01014]